MTIKSYLTDLAIILAIAALGFGGVYLWKLNKDLKLSKAEVTAVAVERDAWKSAKDNLQHTLDQIRADEETAQSLRQEAAVVNKEVQVVVKDRIVYVDRLVQQDPVVNQRQLSPVLAETIAKIQADRKARE